jgi:adenine-specific DNA-methyltransferase
VAFKDGIYQKERLRARHRGSKRKASVRRTKKRLPSTISQRWRNGNHYTLVQGDCLDLLRKLPANSVDLVLTSPPYCIGKSYEDKTEAAEFEADHEAILPEVIRVVRTGGSICWQVGYHVTNGVVTPLDFVVYRIMSAFPKLLLRNRIVWTFGHGLHTKDRFSGRHETLLWFTKGKRYRFNLDAVRVNQKYPGKKHYKGEKKGAYSGNPLGKNPSDVWNGWDVWDIPNVKANHIEKTEHPCQFPIAFALRVIKALTKPNDLVLDPYVGSGSTAAAAIIAGRRFVGSEIVPKFYALAMTRAKAAAKRNIRYRPEGLPVYTPSPNSPLTRRPLAWNETKKN